MPSLHLFVISWAGQHDNAAFIAGRAQGVSDKVSIVYSDPDPDFTLPVDCELIKRPNSLFWADKFQACLDAFHSDFLLVIHADCQCGDWAGLIRKSREAMVHMSDIGVWSPHIDGTYFSVDKTYICDIQGTSLCAVALTDGIVFSLSSSVVSRMRLASYETNIYGWGIDELFCANAFTCGQYVVVDKSIKVGHPVSRGYKGRQAAEMRNDFYRQFMPGERIQLALLRSHIEKNSLIKRIRSSNSMQ